jgi:hypothetical protein
MRTYSASYAVKISHGLANEESSPIVFSSQVVFQYTLLPY